MSEGYFFMEIHPYAGPYKALCMSYFMWNMDFMDIII